MLQLKALQGIIKFDMILSNKFNFTNIFNRFYGAKKKHIITTQTEHKCVLDSCRVLEDEGFKVTYLPVKANGIIDMTEFEKSITSNTSLVSIMAVNNEIG